METLSIKAVEKRIFNKGYNRRLRNKGKIPAVVYDAKGNNTHIIIDHKEFEKVFRTARSHGFIEINYKDKSDKVLVRDYQMEPIQKKYSHVDFYRILPDHEIKAKIPFHFVGSSEGVKQGGLIEHFIFDLSVKCKPEQIIDTIEIDITNLEIGVGIYVRDLKIDERIKVINPKDQCIIRVIQSRKSKTEGEPGKGPDKKGD